MKKQMMVNKNRTN